MEENIKHTVEIDDYIKVELAIPKILSVIELHGLMVKAKKLMSLSSEETTTQPKRTFDHFSDEQNDEIKVIAKLPDDQQKMESNKCADKWNMSVKRVFSKVRYLSKGGYKDAKD